MKALATCAVLLAAGIGTTACGFNRRSSDYTCSLSSDCLDGRSCVEGWCVDGDGGGGPAADGPAVGEDGSSPNDAPAGDAVVFGEAPGTDVSGVTTDAWVDSSDQNNNYGIDDVMRLDRNPDQNGLIRFDLSSLSTGTVITSAEMRLWTEQGFNNDGVVQAFPLNEAWDEGALDGADGAVSWDERAVGVPWLGEGAGGASRAPVPSDDAPARLDGIELVFAIPSELVQSWVDDPGLNRGWVLVPSESGNSAATVISSESPVEDHRPRMVIHHL